MITTAGRQEIANCDVYPDDDNPLQYYVCPQGPRIALDDTGKPIFSLVWYRRDVSKLTDDQRKTQLGGGILAVSVELGKTKEQEDAIRKQLAGNPELQARTRLSKDKLQAELRLDALPISDGSVTIAILAETPDATHPGEFVGSLVGVGGVSMTGTERASFMAKLTQDGVVLLWDMVTRNLPAIRVAYDLTFNYRVQGVEMRAWCDASKVFTAIQSNWEHLSEDASFHNWTDGSNTTVSSSHQKSDSAADSLFTAMGSTQYAGVSVVPSAGADVVKPELISELTEQGNSMIKDFLASTFLEPKVGEDFKPDDAPTLATELPKYGDSPYGSDSASHYKLKTFTQGVTAKLDYRMQEKAVVTTHARPNDNLANVLAGHSVEDLRVRIDIDDAFYRFLDVQVVCTANFDDDPINLVKAHLSYSATGPAGKISKVGDLLFQKGSAPQRFSTYLAAPDQVQYHWELEVYYKDTAAVFKTSGQSNETILVLDVDKLGILKVNVIAGIVDWNNIAQILVDMSCGSDHQTQFILDAQHQTHAWVEVLATPAIPACSYTVTFVDKSGQRLAQDPQSSTAKQLIINQPQTEQFEVIVVAAGSFGQGGLINQIAVALRYNDADNNYNAHNEFILTKAGDSKVWAVPLVNKNLRNYEYQVTVFYSDGITRQDVWHPSDLSILPVGDPFGFRVQILPYLFKQGGWSFGTIDLKFDDSAGSIHTEHTMQITDFTTPLSWQFRLGAPERHTYKYQLTMYRMDGTQVALPPAEASQEVLVLMPPPPA